MNAGARAAPRPGSSLDGATVEGTGADVSAGAPPPQPNPIETHKPAAIHLAMQRPPSTEA
jgi:hypothetical protein